MRMKQPTIYWAPWIHKPKYLRNMEALKLELFIMYCWAQKNEFGSQKRHLQNILILLKDALDA